MSDVVHEPELRDDKAYCRAHGRELRECLAVSESDYWEIEEALRGQVALRIDAETRLAEIAQIIEDRIKASGGRIDCEYFDNSHIERIRQLANGTEK